MKQVFFPPFFSEGTIWSKYVKLFGAHEKLTKSDFCFLRHCVLMLQYFLKKKRIRYKAVNKLEVKNNTLKPVSPGVLQGFKGQSEGEEAWKRVVGSSSEKRPKNQNNPECCRLIHSDEHVRFHTVVLLPD